MKKMVKLAVALLALVVVAYAQQPLNNDSIVKMVKAGLADDTIIAMINSQPGSYAIDTDSLVKLKNNGVSDAVIKAMIAKDTANSAPPPALGGPSAPAPAAAPAPNGPPPGVDEVAVYYKNKDNQWVEMQPEVVNWKTGGFMKSIATEGIVKGDLNGHIKGKSSALSLNTPLDFLIYMSEGVAVTEYQLLRLRESGDAREFRSTTGGVIHSSGGAERDEVEFQWKKIAPRIYEVVLGPEIKAGDYGFLPPGSTSSSNMASSGAIYTFHVIE